MEQYQISQSAMAYTNEAGEMSWFSHNISAFLFAVLFHQLHALSILEHNTHYQQLRLFATFSERQKNRKIQEQPLFSSTSIPDRKTRMRQTGLGASYCVVPLCVPLVPFKINKVIFVLTIF